MTDRPHLAALHLYEVMERCHPAAAAGLEYVLSYRSHQLAGEARDFTMELLDRANQSRRVAATLIEAWQTDVRHRARLDAAMATAADARYEGLRQNLRQIRRSGSDKTP